MSSDPSVVRAHPDGVLVEVLATPGARYPGIFGVHDGALRVKVAAPPEHGKANDAIGQMLCDATGASHARLERGAQHRRKRYFLAGVDLGAVKEALLAE